MRLSRGWGPWREEWYSVCSAHYDFDETCLRCKSGTWVHTWKNAAENVVYAVSPRVWRCLYSGERS